MRLLIKKKNITRFVSVSELGLGPKKMLHQQTWCVNSDLLQMDPGKPRPSMAPSTEREDEKIGDIWTSDLWLGKAGVKESNEETLGRGPHLAQCSLVVLIIFSKL